MIELNAMHFPILISLVFGLILFQPYLDVKAQSAPPEPQVISPRPGEALQGNIEISGVTEISDFVRSEVEFRFTNDPKNTWFLISESDKSVNPGKIAGWDTTTITDGNYDLRVSVILKSGESKSILIPGIRIRNYSPIESPTQQAPGSSINPSETDVTPLPTRTPRPSPVPLPSNPAIFTQMDLNSSLVRGAVVGIGFFLAFGIYWIVKKSLS
jgi:hypothetical protein